MADTGRQQAVHGSALEVLRVALILGLTSFGGPIAHLGYFHREYVERRRWLAESTYLDLVALCQLLPGPASSQVGIGIGLMRAGWRGAFAAWLGFTLPSAAILTGFALLATDADLGASGWVHGLKLAAIAVVAAAIASMWRALAPDWTRRALAVVAAAAMLALPTAAVQVAIIGVGGLAGWVLLRGRSVQVEPVVRSPLGRRAGMLALAIFGALLVGLPVLAAATGSEVVAVADRFYRAGALVFGGGHVVLPLLSESVVQPGWVDSDAFLAGYGAAQAVPGPLFTFAAYLGASLGPIIDPIPGAALAVAAIFLPSFLLVAAAFPYWHELRRSPSFRGVLAGTNAAVIGLLIAALYRPLWTSSIGSPLDIGLVVLAYGALVGLRAPAWAVVGGLALAAQGATIIGGG